MHERVPICTVKNGDSPPRPVLRWAGSKRQTVDRLKKLWGFGYARYVEPFAGSAALFFAIRPASGLLADKNAELIETYRVLRECPLKLHEAVASIPRNKETYYSLRSTSLDFHDSPLGL